MPSGHGPVIIAGFAEPSAVIALGTGVKLGSGTDAADLLAADPDAVAIVEADQMGAFSARLGDTRTMVDAIAKIDGYNYAKGKRVTLTIYRKAPS